MKKKLPYDLQPGRTFSDAAFQDFKRDFDELLAKHKIVEVDFDVNMENGFMTTGFLTQQRLLAFIQH